MAGAQLKVGDVVLSIYPPDYPDDDTYYNAKIVEVGEGEGQEQKFKVSFTDADYDGDPPVDVTRSGLKKKAAKKKRRLRPNLNPNFGKKAASNSVVAEPGAEAGGPTQPRAPPKPTGGGSDTTISESNALAAVGGLDIDNWDNNEDGHLLALTNDKAKWTEVRDALQSVKLKAKELHEEFQVLGTKVPEIAFFFYYHVTGKKGTATLHFHHSNINIVNECLEAMTLCLLHPKAFPSALMTPLEKSAYEYLPRSPHAKKILQQFVGIKGLKYVVNLLITLNKNQKSPKNLIATIDILSDFVTEYGVNHMDIMKLLPFLVGLLDVGRGVKGKAKDLLMQAYKQAGASLAKLLKQKAKDFGLAPKKVKFLLQDFEKISPTGLKDAVKKEAPRVFGKGVPGHEDPGGKGGHPGGKGGHPGGGKAKQKKSQQNGAGADTNSAQPKATDGGGGGGGGGFDLGIPALDLSKYEEYGPLMAKLGNVATGEGDYRDAWKQRVAALEELQKLIEELPSGLVMNRDCVELVRIVGARIDDKNINLQMKALKAAETLVGALPAPEVPKLINLVAPNMMLCFAAKRSVTVAAVAALDAWVQGAAGVDLDPIHIDKMLSPSANVLKERQAAREGVLTWLQKHFARAANQSPPLVNLPKASKLLTKVLVTCMLDRKGPVRATAQEVLVLMLSCGGEFVQAAKTRLDKEIVKTNPASQRQLKSKIEDIYFQAGVGKKRKKENAKPKPTTSNRSNRKPKANEGASQDTEAETAPSNRRKGARSGSRARSRSRGPSRGGAGGGGGGGGGKVSLALPDDTKEQIALKKDLHQALNDHDYDRVVELAKELKRHHRINSKERVKKAQLSELRMHMNEASDKGNYDRVAELAKQMKKIQQEEPPSPQSISAPRSTSPLTPDTGGHSGQYTSPRGSTPEGGHDGRPPINKARRGRMGMLPGNNKGGASGGKRTSTGAPKLSRKAAELKLSYYVADCKKLLHSLESEAQTYKRESHQLERMVNAPQNSSDFERKHLRDEIVQRKEVVIPSLATRLRDTRSDLGHFVKDYKTVLGGCFDLRTAKQLLKDVKVKVRKLVEQEVLERRRPDSAQKATAVSSFEPSVPSRGLVSEPSNFRASVDQSLLEQIKEKEKSVRTPIMEKTDKMRRNHKRNAVNTARLDPLGDVI